MGLQLSRNHKAADHAYDNSPRQGNTEIELAHVSENVYDSIQRGDRDEHTYGDAGVAASENATKVRKSSEIILSRSVIVLVVAGMILISTVISIITGIVVYHVGNGKITPMDLEEQQNSSNMADIDRRLNMLDRRIQEKLNTDMADIDRRLNTLDRLIQAKQNSSNMADIDRRLDTLERMTVTDMAYINRRLDMLHAIILEVEGTVDDVREKQNTSVQKIAFTVHTPTGANIQHTPTFKYILLNEGGAYNTSTGLFTCPVQGLYLFTVTLRGVYTRSIRVYCHLLLNNDRVTLAYSEGGPYDSASVTTFIHLSLGDIVEITCYRWQEIDKDMGTLFSGALIWAD